MTQLKNRVDSVLHADLVRRRAAKLFSEQGRLGSAPNPFRRIRRGLLFAISVNTLSSPSSLLPSKSGSPETLANKTTDDPAR
jgi:hypothetical protein